MTHPRIHSIRVSSTSSNAVAAQHRRPDRIPRVTALFAYPRLLAATSIPGFVKLLRVFLARDAREVTTTGQVERVLAIVQQRLVTSKVNDGWGFELLECVVRGVDP